MQAHVDDSRVSWKIYIFLTSLCSRLLEGCKNSIALDAKSVPRFLLYDTNGEIRAFHLT